MLRLKNGRVLRDGVLVDEEEVWVDLKTGKILDPMVLFYQASTSAEIVCSQVVDCQGRLVCPGFIDVQFNGGFGIDFSSVSQVTPGSIEECCQKLPSTGVTSFCPTLISLKRQEYKHLIPLLGPRDGKEINGASILGIHVEGPFFNKAKIGAHPLENILVPCQTELTQVYGEDLDNLRILTIAPELPGSIDIIEAFLQHKDQQGREARKSPDQHTKRKNRVVSIGHSGANLEDAYRGVEHGATMITHLFNAMGAFHHRDPGIIGLLGKFELHGKLFYGLISDGFHADPASVAMAYRSHPKGAVLVTDAMSAMGLPVGMYQLGSQHVEVREEHGFMNITAKKAVVAGTDTLAGSVVSMDVCVRNFQHFTGCKIERAIEAATLHPAKVLGLEREKGTLDFGADGDIVLLNPLTLEVEATFVKGHLVYSSDDKYIPQTVC